MQLFILYYHQLALAVGSRRLQLILDTMVGVVISVIGPPLLDEITVVIVTAATTDVTAIIVLFIHELFNCFIDWFIPDSIFYSILALFPRRAVILLITLIML